MASVTRWLSEEITLKRARRFAEEHGVHVRTVVVFEMPDATYQDFEEFKRRAASAGIPLDRLADRKV